MIGQLPEKNEKGIRDRGAFLRNTKMARRDG
jgi:hypothetical protein